MNAELPEGVGREDAIAHALSTQVMAQILNLCARYMGSPEGSGEEEVAEQKLGDAIEAVVKHDPAVVGNVILAMASMVVELCEPDDVQKWFDFQQAKIVEVLGG